MFLRIFACVAVAALTLASAATAHVTLNPGEWEAGGFARFAVRVPNERDNADAIEVTVRFPETIISASFQPQPGWKRTVEMAELDEPVEEFGEEVTERIASVTWSGGRIRPGEFEEFGISFRVPETPGEDLVFPSLQTYSNGEVVRWIGPPDSDEPAPIVAVLEPAEDEGGQPAATPQPPPAAAPAATADEDEGSGLAVVALIVAIVSLVAGLGALALAWTRTPRGRPVTRS